MIKVKRRLSPSDLPAIQARAKHETHAQIAESYSVSKTTITRFIRTGGKARPDRQNPNGSAFRTKRSSDYSEAEIDAIIAKRKTMTLDAIGEEEGASASFISRLISSRVGAGDGASWRPIQLRPLPPMDFKPDELAIRD